MGKSDENDVRLLRTLYRRQPELFQPLFTSPGELEVRVLTELWVELAGQKKSAKLARTTTENPVAVETYRAVRRLVERLAEEIHEEALKLPLYRRAFEELGLKGPALAYIVSHDAFALGTLPRDKLMIRYEMVDRRRRSRKLRSQLLVLLAMTAVRHKHPKYYDIYQHYRNKNKKHWSAILRVAERILQDLKQLNEDRQHTQKAGPPA